MKKIIYLTIATCFGAVLLVLYYAADIQEHIKEEALTSVVTNFELMLDTRRWNAENGGVYVKQHDGLQPNKYLKDNVLLSDKNETLIKINPAWMTRQISQISNQNNKIYYHMTSLKPINPINAPDTFEQEGLKYFEKNPDEKFYYKFNKRSDGKMVLDFIGALKTEKVCLKCHAIQGYKEGDIRGGIRVSTPMAELHENISYHNKIEIIILILIFFISVVFIFIAKKYFQEMRIKEDREKTLLLQSKQLAMNEMIIMIAHQWRQPLAVLGMNVNNLLLDITMGNYDEKKFIKETKDIDNTIQELSKTINTFSNLFSKDSNFEQLTLISIQEELCDIIDKSYNFKNIEIVKDWKSEKKANISKNEFMQACYMILTNSQEAMIEKNIKNPQIISKTWDEGSTIHYTICDNAGGIDEEYLDKVFEPYFSTKSYNGRGLGLTIVKSVIEDQHKGKISIKNKGDGLCVHIELPAILE